MFRKDFPQGPLDERNKPAKLLKEGCLMIYKGIKGLIKSNRLKRIPCQAPESKLIFVEIAMVVFLKISIVFKG